MNFNRWNMNIYIKRDCRWRDVDNVFVRVCLLFWYRLKRMSCQVFVWCHLFEKDVTPSSDVLNLEVKWLDCVMTFWPRYCMVFLSGRSFWWKKRKQGFTWWKRKKQNLTYNEQWFLGIYIWTCPYYPYYFTESPGCSLINKLALQTKQLQTLRKKNCIIPQRYQLKDHVASIWTAETKNPSHALSRCKHEANSRSVDVY